MIFYFSNFQKLIQVFIICFNKKLKLNILGELTIKKASIVNNKALALVAMYYDFDLFIIMANREENLRKIKQKKKEWHDLY